MVLNLIYMVQPKPSTSIIQTSWEPPTYPPEPLTKDPPIDTKVVYESAPDDYLSWISHPDNLMPLGFSAFLLIGTIIWLCIWFKQRRNRISSKIDIKRNRKDNNNYSKAKQDKQTSKSFPTYKQTEQLPGYPKTPSLASIQSTGSNYYDQLMGSGNIPKVKSISQYGALLAQQEPPPP